MKKIAIFYWEKCAQSFKTNCELDKTKSKSDTLLKKIFLRGKYE